MVEHLVVAEAGVGSNPIKAPRAEAALYSAGLEIQSGVAKRARGWRLTTSLKIRLAPYGVV